MKSSAPAPPTGNPLQLMLATGAFAICFAVFGSVSAMMPSIKDTLGLSPFQVSLAIALPVLLGSLGRIPLGMLTDRFGGRIVFAIVMAITLVPAFLIGLVSSYVVLPLVVLVESLVLNAECKGSCPRTIRQTTGRTRKCDRRSGDDRSSSRSARTAPQARHPFATRWPVSRRP